MTELAAHASSKAHSWPRRSEARSGPGRAPCRGAGAAALTAPPGPRPSATYLRCGGCGAAAVYAQSEPGYGRLVHGFLDWHEQCGNAVEISAALHPAAEGSGRDALAADNQN